MSWRRSAAAVIAGLAAVAVPSALTDAALHASGIFPPAGEPMLPLLWILAIAYRAYYGVVSGYLTARLAPDRPVRLLTVPRTAPREKPSRTTSSF